LFWLTRGTIRITAEFHPIMATGPKVLFIPASMPLSLELPTQLQGHVAYFPNLADLELPQTSLCLTPSSAEAQVELTGLIERMARLEDQDTPSARRMKRGFGLLLSAMLERETLISNQRDRDATHRLRTQIKKPSKSAQLLSRFAALLAQGFNAQLGVSDYAARLDVTPTHLTRICREITGRTALALINEVLMAEARRRLVDTDDSAAKIARDLGYSSPAYFTRAFGQETGTTPTAYRDQKQGQWSARATDSPCFT
jgi:AraC family transcriptional activator of pobA